MTQEVKLKRVQCNYQPENSRFLLECDFSKQYDHYYRKRLERTRPYVEFNCRSRWDPSIPIYNLSEVANFSVQAHSDVNSDLGSLSPLSPPDIKRFRRLSSSTASPVQRSSTQLQAQQPGHDNSTDSPLLESQFTSPIAGQSNAQQILSSRASPAIRRHPDSVAPECIIIGTIFKRMKLQPDVVEELSKGNFHVKCERYLGHYTSQDDSLVLEDTEESIMLVGNINPKQFVTGIVVALLGVSIDDGSQFLVYDICFAEPNRQILYEESQASQQGLPPMMRPTAGTSTPIYLMVVSGLGFHHEMDKKSALTRALQDMIDFIWGGGRFEDDPRSSRVTRILVVGNSLHGDRFASLDDEDSQDSDRDEIVARMRQSRQVKPYSETIQATKHMDDFFAQLSKTINVDVMPGPSDPSSHLMPQQPFHPCMFPKSCMFSTFNCVSNPHYAIYNDTVDVLATSGQNVDIISKFSGLTDPLDIMKCHLLWGNCAPSAPDNLYSVPYEDDDPYVIDFIPDIYIAGCQKAYKTGVYEYRSSSPVALDENDGTRRSGFAARADTENMNVTADSLGGSCNNSLTPITASSSSRSRTRDPALWLPDGTPRVAGELGGRRHDDTFEDGLESMGSVKKSSTLLITVPEFCETFSCVLIDLNNLKSELLSFQ